MARPTRARPDLPGSPGDGALSGRRGDLEQELHDPFAAEALEVGPHVDVRPDGGLLPGGAGPGGDERERDGVLAEAPLGPTGQVQEKAGSPSSTPRCTL